MQKTLTRQSQIATSLEVDDGLPLGYTDAATLEADLNYLRSVIRDLKGTVHYDSPLLSTLTELADALANVSFHDATLTGNSTSETPAASDSSDRIATTRFVSEKLALAGGDSRYIHAQDVASNVWVITNPFDKTPSVITLDSAKGEVIGHIAYDSPVNPTTITITFESAISGKAFLN